jgi:hypothetical protein
MHNMKHKQFSFFNTIKTGMLFLLCGGLLTGCLPSSPGGSSRGERKKMFTLDGTDGLWEGYSLSASGAKAGSGQPGMADVPMLPFTVSDTLLQQSAGLHPYVLLRLSSADYDFLLLGAKNFEAWLPGWLKSWSQTGREGLMIDLSAGKATGRSVFRLTAPGLDNPVPLVLLWDDAAEKRAGFYTGLLQSFTTIQCENLQSEKCN